MPYCIKCGATLTADDDRWGCARLGLCRECAYEEAPPGSGLPPLVPTAAAREAMKTRGGIFTSLHPTGEVIIYDSEYWSGLCGFDD